MSKSPPILTGKDFAAPFAFPPESLLREARRQKCPGEAAVPEACLPDPDRDIVRRLARAGYAPAAGSAPVQLAPVR